MDIKTIDKIVNENFEDTYGLSGEISFLDMYNLDDYIDFEKLIRASKEEIRQELDMLDSYIILGCLNFVYGVNEEETLHLADYSSITEDMIRTILIYKNRIGFDYAEDFTIEGIYQSFLNELKEVIIDGLIEVKNKINI